MQGLKQSGRSLHLGMWTYPAAMLQVGGGKKVVGRWCAKCLAYEDLYGKN